jgi:hypothetical protein
MTDLDQNYRQLYHANPGRFSFSAKTVEELSAWQRAFRPQLEEALGLDRMRQDLAAHKPRAERISSEPVEEYTRESWLLWVEPSLALPFYLLKPRMAQGPLPLVLTPHGHNPPHLYAGIFTTEEERRNIVEGDRDIAVQAVKQGYLALAPTARGFGETRTEADKKENRLSSCRTQLMHGLLYGRTPIGERVWDLSRLLDWALDNLDVDNDRVAITGNSGGGTIAIYAGACDDRITVVAPSCYFCTFAGSIGSIHHCDCNYIPGLLRLGEMYDVAGLIAPRPFCAIAGETDDIFPIAEVRVAYEKLLHIYAVAGVPDHCQLYIGKGGHRYFKEGAWPFINGHFKK